MRRAAASLVLVVSVLVGGSSATAHELDHPAPGFTPPGAPLSTAFNAGGEGASWELHTTILTGNPHTDIDVFRRNGELFLSAGTLATGANRGGQTIVQLTKKGEVDPAYVGAHPSAACPSNPSSALGLQHDVEATPKGGALLNTSWGRKAVDRDAQLIVDATDAGGRCHDQAPAGLTGNPRGGLEIVDVTDPAKPVELALTRHIGEAHTVNIDPSRPHIAYVSGSDRVGIDAEGRRTNESDTGQPFNLDGFEVVDLSSCMDFPAKTSVQAKRDRCRPQVHRFRFELGWTRGTYANGFQAACHELEVHPNDVLTCAGLDGTVVLDMKGAFDGKGRPRGQALACDVVKSATSGSTATGAMVTDCVTGKKGADLRVPAWLKSGAPSLQGVKLVGFVNHGGREVSNNAVSHSPAEDVAVAHEAELTHSGKHVLVSDERGGGIVPPDAACPAVGAQSPNGNGGLHAYATSRLATTYPAVLAEDGTIDGEATAAKARAAYAKTPEGEPAIVRATPRVPAESNCTAHVFHQVPGQNRIFMGWYGQGTQVIDYVEHPNGTFEWIETAYFVPEHANTWVSDVFKVEKNKDGTYTYWGASADFALANRGRNAIDVYKVTLPAPRQLADGTMTKPAAKPAKPAQAAAPSDGHTDHGHDAQATATTKVIDVRQAALVDQQDAPPSPVRPMTMGILVAVLAAGAVLAVAVPRRRRLRADEATRRDG